MVIFIRIGREIRNMTTVFIAVVGKPLHTIDKGHLVLKIWKSWMADPEYFLDGIKSRLLLILSRVSRL